MAGGCTMLDFVETPSANSEVFVDTRYTPLCTDRVETKVEFGTISGNEIVFSSRQNDTDDVNSKHLTCFRISAKLRFDRYNKYGHATSGTLATKTPYEIVADFGNLRYTVNDEGPFATTSGVGDFTAYTNILLFATGKLNDSTYKLSSFANSCRMYYFPAVWIANLSSGMICLNFRSREADRKLSRSLFSPRFLLSRR